MANKTRQDRDFASYEELSQDKWARRVIRDSKDSTETESKTNDLLLSLVLEVRLLNARIEEAFNTGIDFNDLDKGL